MKTTITSIILFLSITCNLQAQVNPASLIGKWNQVEINGEGNIKCPYQLEFKEDKKYIVYDCREPKDSNGIAEMGFWAINEQMLSLTKRVFFGDTYFQPKSRGINCSIKTVKATKLVIIYRFPKGEITEEYIKVQ